MSDVRRTKTLHRVRQSDERMRAIPFTLGISRGLAGSRKPIVSGSSPDSLWPKAAECYNTLAEYLCFTPRTLRSSSVVEQSAVNRLVVGSNPTCGAKCVLPPRAGCCTTSTYYKMTKVASASAQHRTWGAAFAGTRTTKAGGPVGAVPGDSFTRRPSMFVPRR